jgi:Mrp family chromosome partitioning ATPase
LATGRIRKIVSEAIERFELVIIDGPPTIGLADAPLLASMAENVLFVIESAQTRTRAAVEALNRLEATGAHVLGALLTKSKETNSRYGYASYGYGYGYGQGRIKRTEILMIPQDEEVPAENVGGESSA